MIKRLNNKAPICTEKVRIKICLSLMILLALIMIPAAAAFAEDVDELYLNNVVAPESQYNTMMSPIYQKTVRDNVSADTQSGSLKIVQTDFSLPGRNGLDLNITRIYNSDLANLYEMDYSASTSNNYLNKAGSVIGLDNRYNLGTGWRFSFPMLEVKSGGLTSRQVFYHDDKGNTYSMKGTPHSIVKIPNPEYVRLSNMTYDTERMRYEALRNIPTTIDSADYFIYAVEDNPMKRFELKDDSGSFTNGQDNGKSAYVLVEKDGKKTYFTDDGRVLGILDRYSNTIKFEYKYFLNKNLIYKITDTVGRQVVFDYISRLKDIYISDMAWTSATGGHGPVEKNRSNGEAAAGDGRTITLNGKTYAKGLGTHPNSEIVYNLGGRFDTFISDIGVDDEAGDSGSVTFQVWTDNVMIYDSGRMSGSSAAKTINADVKGKNVLKLVVTNGGDGNAYDHADWAGARLTGLIDDNVTVYLPDATPIPNETKKETYLSDMAWISSNGGYGPAEKNMSNGESVANDGGVITLNGKTYPKGLGTHAGSEIKYSLGGKYDNFISDIGVDDEVGGNGTVIFQVWADDGKLYDSGLMAGSSATKSVDVDVRGKNELKLIVTDGGNGNYKDHADWAGARLKNTQINMDNLNDNTKLIYKKEVVDDGGSTASAIKTWLAGVIDTDGKMKYSYRNEFIDVQFDFNQNTGNDGNVYNKYVCITRIDYCKTNLLKTFSYDTFTKRLGSVGYMKHRKVNAEAVYEKTGWDALKKDYTTVQKNSVRYSYTNPSDGYGVSGYNISDKNYLKNNYRYYAVSVNKAGITKKYTYNGIHDIIQVEESGSSHKTVENMEYDDNRMLNKAETIMYQPVIVTTVAGNSAAETINYINPVKVVENFTYDVYGDLLNYTGPLAARDANGKPLKPVKFMDLSLAIKMAFLPEDILKELKALQNSGFGGMLISSKMIDDFFTTGKAPYPPIMSYIQYLDEYTVTYTYDQRYHILTSKTWKQDASTVCGLEYTVDKKGNVTQEEKLHTENGVKNNTVTGFLYDSYGNMISKTISKDGNPWYVESYEYGNNFDNNADLQGAYMTRKYVTASDGKAISTWYACDFYRGLLTKIKDPDGDITSYLYDILNRITSITYPDESSKQYIYNEYPYKDREIEYTDQTGARYLISYDIENNVTNYSVWDKDIWNTIGSYKYDSENNKIKETDPNGNYTTYAYDTANRMTCKTYCDGAVGPKGIVKYDYEVGVDGYALKVTETDEEEYKKISYYDSVGWLKKQEVSPDKKILYTTVYTYDYMGNKICVKNGRGYKTSFAYDDLGRLVCQKDEASGNVTLTVYDKLGNIVKKVLSRDEAGMDFTIRPGDNVTEHIYDKAGRLQTEKVYTQGSSDYTYTTNIWKTASNNIESVAKGVFKEGKLLEAAFMSYLYDDMDRITDAFGKVDETVNTHTEYAYYPGGETKSINDYIDDKGDQYIEHSFEYDYAGRTMRETGMMTAADIQGGYFEKLYAYDYAGNLKNYCEFAGRDDSGNALYNKVAITYDYRNSPLEIKEPYGTGTRTTSFIYDKKGNAINKSISFTGEEIGVSYEYDGLGRVIRTIDGYGNVTRRVYDENGNEIREIDARYYSKAAEEDNPGSIYTLPGKNFYYDSLDRLYKTSILDKYGIETVLSYMEFDCRGNIVKKADGEGYDLNNPSAAICETYEYDASNRVIRYVSAEGIARTYEYDGTGRVISETDGNLNKTTNEYFMNGALKKKTYPDFTEDTFTYDRTGKYMSEKTDTMGNKTTTFYNIWGKVISITYPDETIESFTYTPAGLVKTAADRNGNVTEFQYDPADNLLLELRNYASDAEYTCCRGSQYEYNVEGKLSSRETVEYRKPLTGGAPVVIRAGDREAFTYDKAGRLVRKTGPEGSETIYAYDKAGYLSEQKDKVQDGYYNIKKYTYDVQGRLTKEIQLVDASDVQSEYQGAADPDYSGMLMSCITYTYYKNSRVNSAKDSYGNGTFYKYDNDGRLVREIDGLGNTTLNTYDNNGNLIFQTNPRKKTTFYYYDCMNKLVKKTQLSLIAGLDVTLYLYDNVGNLVKEISPNGYNPMVSSDEMKGTSYEYDSMKRVTSVTSAEGNVIKRCTYDGNGNLIKVVDGLRYNGDIETSPGQMYTYDAFNKATSVTDAVGGQVINTYDMQGNLASVTDALGYKTEYGYGPGKLLHKIFYPDGGVAAYTYDCLGRMTVQEDQRGNKTSYEYNAFGKVQKETDMFGFTILNKYDMLGNLIRQTDKRGNDTLFAYDALNRLVEKKTPLDSDNGSVSYKVVNYTYDAAGNTLSIKISGTSPDAAPARETCYSYYINDLPATISDNGGHFIRNSYDRNGNLTKVETLKEGNTYDIAMYEYDAMDRKTASIKLVEEDSIYNASELPDIVNLRDNDHPGMIRMITGYEYDMLGNKIRQIDPTAYGYLQEDASDKDRYTTEFKYDVLNRLTNVKKFCGDKYAERKYAYDANGSKVEEINEKEAKTHYTYDCMDRLLSVADPLGNTTEYEYDACGNRICMTDALGNKTKYSYDELNMLVKVTDAYERDICLKEYDANGNVIKLSDANGNSTIFLYDMANRQVKVIDAEGTCPLEFVYNQFGELTEKTDGLGNSTKYIYDSAGKLSSATDATGNQTCFTFDNAGNRTGMTDALGRTTQYRYGAFGMRLGLTDPAGISSAFGYDLNANMVYTLDGRGIAVNYEYDNRGLLLKRSASTAGSCYYSYDEAGNRTGTADDSGMSEYSYDAGNRLVGITKDGRPQISYEYDAAGNITALTAAGTFRTDYTYDRCGRMITVASSGATAAYGYDANGNKQTVEYGGGVKSNFIYDRDNRLIRTENLRPDNSVISSYAYSYDGAGRQSEKTDEYGTTHYTYDAAGRILRVEAPGMLSEYTYDGAGNRISLNETYISEQPGDYTDTVNGMAITYIIKKSLYSYSVNNELLQLTEVMNKTPETSVLSKTTNYAYDANGNLTSQFSGFLNLYSGAVTVTTGAGSVFGMGIEEEGEATVTETVDNTYDGFNRLIRSIKTGNSGTSETSFIYDGDDLRVGKISTISGVKENTCFIYAGSQVVAETDGSGSLKVSYVRGLDYISRLDASGKQSYYLYNGHGDVVQTVSPAGEVENRYEFDIWGNALLTLTQEQYANDIRYAGELYDTETGLYYQKARYYDPYVGRFINEDSFPGVDAEPLSLNLYTYCENDPISYIDPSGHWPDLSNAGKWAQNVLSQAGKSINKGINAISKGIKAGIKAIADSISKAMDIYGTTAVNQANANIKFAGEARKGCKTVYKAYADTVNSEDRAYDAMTISKNAEFTNDPVNGVFRFKTCMINETVYDGGTGKSILSSKAAITKYGIANPGGINIPGDVPGLKVTLRAPDISAEISLNPSLKASVENGIKAGNLGAEAKVSCVTIGVEYNTGDFIGEANVSILTVGGKIKAVYNPITGEAKWDKGIDCRYVSAKGKVSVYINGVGKVQLSIDDSLNVSYSILKEEAKVYKEKTQNINIPDKSIPDKKSSYLDLSGIPIVGGIWNLYIPGALLLQPLSITMGDQEFYPTPEEQLIMNAYNISAEDMSITYNEYKMNDPDIAIMMNAYKISEEDMFNTSEEYLSKYKSILNTQTWNDAKKANGTDDAGQAEFYSSHSGYDSITPITCLYQQQQQAELNHEAFMNDYYSKSMEVQQWQQQQTDLGEALANWSTKGVPGTPYSDEGTGNWSGSTSGGPANSGGSESASGGSTSGGPSLSEAAKAQYGL